MDVLFFPLATVEDKSITAVVIVSKYSGKWLFVRNKNKNTFENPGGQRELNESLLDTARRELYEETGATDFMIEPVVIYKAETRDTYHYGLLCYADINKIDKLPNFEIAEIMLCDDIPSNLSYPVVSELLFNKVREYINQEF